MTEIEGVSAKFRAIGILSIAVQQMGNTQSQYRDVQKSMV